jgi:hypothetical protein
MIEFIDKTGENSGTPLNRKNMMSLQGFEAVKTTFNADGSITEENELGQEKTTVFNTDGTIVETFVGEKTITKITRFVEEGMVEEVIS